MPDKAPDPNVVAITLAYLMMAVMGTIALVISLAILWPRIKAFFS